MELSDLESALKNPKKFKQLFKSVDDLTDAAHQFPKYAKDLIRFILSDIEEFRRLVTDSYDLKNLMLRFPSFANELLALVLNTPNELERLIGALRHLECLTAVLTKHAARELIKRSFTLTDPLGKPIIDIYSLIIFKKYFPDSSELLKPLFDNPELCKQVLTSFSDCTMVVEDFPDHAEKLLIPLFEDSKCFEQIIFCNNYFRQAGKLFPKHTEMLIRQLFKNSTLFKKIINDNYSLIETAKVFHQFAEELVCRVLNDSDEFKRLITDINEMKETKEIFPKYSIILDQENIESALAIIIENENKQAINDLNRINKHSYLMGISRRRGTNIFSTIPKEVAEKIIGDIRESRHVSDKRTQTVFQNAYDQGLAEPDKIVEEVLEDHWDKLAI